MKLEQNDPKLTAYALGELSEAESQSIENELQNNPEARQTVDEIRALSEQLRQHYAAEESPGLTPEQRQMIGNTAAKKPTGKILLFPSYVWAPLLSAAALFVLFLSVFNNATVVELDTPPPRSVPPPCSIPEQPDPHKAMPIKKAKISNEELKPSGEPTWVVSERKLPDMNIQIPEVSGSGKAGFGGCPTEGIAFIDSRPKLQDLSMMGSSRSKNIQPSTTGFSTRSLKSRAGFSQRRVDRLERYSEDSRQVDRLSSIAPGPSIENYTEIRGNSFERVSDQPLSTFSIDVDTASYSNMRRFLKNGTLPPKDAVRIEELINYFDYNYRPPQGKTPFSANFEMAVCPWNEQHKLVRIGLKGRVIEQTARPPLNLVFLLDVSGSMSSENKLPLVKRAMGILTQQLDERDHVAIVVYAGASGLVLPSTSGTDRQAILDALERLQAGGGTDGGSGIQLAYKTALEHFNREGVNRVILCTDGDFNIGITQGGDLNQLIEEKAKDGIFLSVLGFGMGNYKDGTLEQLADRGNGNYAYIDTFSEARKVLVDQMSGTLVTIAKDVKIQVEFNPACVAGYRLIGYENRMLKAEDFNDDKKDAGEIGAGHTVTAFYEIVPAGLPVDDKPAVDELKYQTAPPATRPSDELLTVKLRYKEPDGDVSTKLEFPLFDESNAFARSSDDFRFATSVAGFGMLLRDSEHKGSLTVEQILEWAVQAQGSDPFGYRREFTDLVRNAQAIKR